MIATASEQQFQNALTRASASGGAGKVRRLTSDRWAVSGTGAVYLVRDYGYQRFCSCPARVMCWHLGAVILWQRAQLAALAAARTAAPSGRFNEGDLIDNGPTAAERFGLKEAF